MNDFIQICGQMVVSVFSAIVLYYSFRNLNHCTKETGFVTRVSLILYFTGAVGSMLLLLSGKPVDWSYGLFIIATAFHLSTDRRKSNLIMNFVNKLHSGKH